MFDARTGRITFDDGLTVGPGTPMDEVRHAWPASTTRDMSTGWQWVGLGEVGIGGTVFAVDLGFHDLALERVTLMLVQPGDELGWDGWTMEQETRRDDEQRAWLTAVTGSAAGELPWGRYGSSYDSKGGFSSIHVRYGD